MATAMAAAPKRQLNKKIWDWRDLESAVSEGARLSKETELSKIVLDKARRFGARVAQLDERVIAVGGEDCIALMYAHTSPGGGIDTLRLQSHVRVFPAQGGRTTYEISQHVNGWFANRWLPLNARDRGNKSVHRETKWYYGQSGVYSPGIGPFYSDVGPACCNTSVAELGAMLESAERVASDAKVKVMSCVERLLGAIAPFADIIPRFSTHSTQSDDREFVSVESWVTGRRFESAARWAVRVRLKTPAVCTNGYWQQVHDFVLSICGPDTCREDSPDVWYAVSRCHSGRMYCSSRDTGNGSLAFAATTNSRSAIEVARQWCADNLYIPA